MNSDWHQAHAEIVSFEPEELLGTKLRACLQRQKNRDLFDLSEGLLLPNLDRERLIDCFLHSVGLEGRSISRANAEERMLLKLNHSLTEDVTPMLPPGVRFDGSATIAAFGRVWCELIQRIPGDSWKSSDAVIAAIRATKIPTLLDGVPR